MYFSNLLNTAFLIWHHYIPSPFLPRGKMLYLRTFLTGLHLLGCWSNVCSPNAKTTDQRPINCSPCSLSALWEQNSSAGLPFISVTDTGLKGIGQDFKTLCKASQGRRERGICICCRTSASSFSLEEVTSVQPLPSPLPALVVRSAQRYC